MKIFMQQYNALQHTDQEFYTSGSNSKEKQALIKSDHC